VWRPCSGETARRALRGCAVYTAAILPREGAEEGAEEEALARDAAAGALAGEVLGVEGVEEGAGDEVGRPDWGGDRSEGVCMRGRTHGRGRDEEAADDAAEGEAHELGGHDDEPLVCGDGGGSAGVRAGGGTHSRNSTTAGRRRAAWR
jgi:hypothetical protein